MTVSKAGSVYGTPGVGSGRVASVYMLLSFLSPAKSVVWADAPRGARTTRNRVRAKKVRMQWMRVMAVLSPEAAGCANNGLPVAAGPLPIFIISDIISDGEVLNLF
jgi:hypothetical protein